MKKNILPYHQKEEGFRVPQGYFDQLEVDLMDMVDGVDIMKAGKFEENKSSGFTTPEDYFTDFKFDIPKEKAGKPRVISLLREEAFYYAAAIAAVFIALVTTLDFNPVSENSWETMELSVLENYIDEDNINFSTSEISSFIFQDGYVIDDSDFHDLDSDAALDYLNENIEDPSFVLE